MIERAEATWRGGLQFSSRSGSGHEVAMDGQMEGALGARPKEMVLSALLGCTGMDVAAIMAKMQKPPKQLRLEAEAESEDAHPKVFTQIRLTYRAEGEDGDQAGFVRAVELSYTKYCPVAAMLKAASRLSYQAYWNGRLVASDGA